jgi:DNA-binding IclR family transcriptional regulator
VEEANAPGRYRLGPAAMCLAALVHGQEFPEYARAFVREVSVLTGETAYATVYDYPYTVVVIVAEGSGPVGPRVPIGCRRPLHASASGKVYLAYERPKVLEAYLARRLEAWTANTLTAPAQIVRALADVRQCGFAVDQGESYEGVCGVAAPVFGTTETVIGTLSVSVADRRLEPERVRRLASPLVSSARELTSRLQNARLDWRC